MSGSAMEGGRERYMELTVYVSKPINPQALFAAIANCTGQEPTDIPHAKAVVKQAAPDVSNAGDDLQDLMNDLDALIKEA